MSRLSHLLLFAVLILCLVGCSAQAPLNQPLESWQENAGYRFPGIQESDASEDLLVVLTFSGGGTRAAALAWGVLETLRETEIVRDGERYRLIDEIDLISAVSGGSIVGAYFALHGEDAFDEFPRRFLYNDLQGKAVSAAISPRRWRKLASDSFNRTDVVADVFDREIFDGAVFGDLEDRRPFLLVNATDITQGVPFPFTQRRFDMLCSDLSTFPIARAVAASSAVPVLFPPLTVASYGWDCGYRPPAWIDEALNDMQSLEKRRLAEVLTRDQARPWVHLLDGGVADNVGLQILYDFLFAPDARSCEFLRKRPSDVIVVAVEAGTGLDESGDFRRKGPTVPQIVWAASNTSVDRLTERALDGLGDQLRSWTCSRSVCGLDWPACEASPTDVDEPLPGTRLYPIVVSLQNVVDAGERSALQGVPTTLSLDRATVDRLRRAGRTLLEESPAFRRLIDEEIP